MKFQFSAAKLKLLHSPNEFYQQLIFLCTNARDRISLSALYLGTGNLEGKLVQATREAASRGVRVTYILDAARARRRDKNGNTSLSILSCLKNEFPQNVTITTKYNNSFLSRLLDVLPTGRICDALGLFLEIYGVFHIKIFAIDHTSILCGANLSETYFTNRLDRYFVIQDKSLARWHHHLTDYFVAQENEKINATKNSFRNTITDISILSQKQKRHSKLRKNRKKNKRTKFSVGMVWCFPAMQNFHARIRQEEKLLFELIDTATLLKGSSLGLATAYLNPPQDLINKIVKDPISIDIIFPASSAHGFASASGLRGIIPLAYNKIVQDLSFALSPFQNKRLYAWQLNTNDSFHAKGVWLFQHGSALATITGSSNFNKRARQRDIELSYLLCSSDTRLRRAWTNEWHTYLRNTTRIEFFDKDKEEEATRPLRFYIYLSRLFFSSFL
uniref:CDP-diacylglycerol--glycerol-3-phosphate 3-phosphatidyltransferase n=1 Tax=Aureoumbra lagunensis TaxID=44058 RepID=A0A7S3JRV9_9STRA